MQPVNSLRFVSEDDFKHTPVLTAEKISLLERANCVSNFEKVCLLALMSGMRWLTEVDISKSGNDANPDVANLLNSLGLAWSSKFYVKKDGTRVSWIEVGANRAVVDYVNVNRDRLSVLEAGILYGYPVTAVLATSGILQEKRKKVGDKTIAESCLGGIFSKDYEKSESEFLKTTWEDLRAISNAIIQRTENNSSQLRGKTAVGN